MTARSHPSESPARHAAAPSPRGVRRPAGRRPGPDGRARIASLVVVDPANLSTCAATTPGRSTCRSAWWCRPRAARTCSRGPWTPRARTGPRPCPATGSTATPRRLVQHPEHRAPLRLDRPPRGRGRRAPRPAGRAGGGRAGRPLLLRPRLPGAGRRAGARRGRRQRRAGQLGAAGEVAGGGRRRCAVAGRIADAVMQVAVDGVREGRRQCDVVAEIQQAQALGSGDARRRLPRDRADAPHGRVRRDAPPDVERRPAGARRGDDDRAGRGLPALPRAARPHRRARPPRARLLATCADAVGEGLEAALEELRPGRTGADAHRAFTRAIGRHGFTKESRIGYSIGIGYPPDWGERTVSLRADATTVLAPGMAFHVILGMWMDGWGYETSEPVRAHRGRCRAAHHGPPG